MAAPLVKRGWWLLVATPPLALASMVAIWGVDLPYWDQWALIPHLEARQTGTLSLSALWAQHNEHRLLVPQLAMLGLAELTGWDIRVELAFNIVLALALLGVIGDLIRQTIESPPYWLLPVISVLVFSPGQWENWIWGWQIQIFLNVLAVAASIALLVDPRSHARFAGALVCAVVACFSFANGLLIWGLGLPLVLRHATDRKARALTWLGAAAITSVFYLQGFGMGERPSFFAEGVARTAKLFGGYVSIYLGAPLLGFHGHLAMFGGFLLILAVAVWVGLSWRRHGIDWWTGPRLPWALLAAYAVASSVLTGYGRLHFGLGQALTSRYVTLSTLLWIGVVGLLAIGTERLQARRWVLVALLPLAMQWLVGAGQMRTMHDQRSQVRAAILDGRPADLGTVYPDPRVAEDHLLTLRRLGLGIYRE